MIEGRSLAPVVDGGLTSDQVAGAVQVNSPEVTNAELELRAAEARIHQARVAAFPILDLTASYTRLSPIEQPPLEFAGQSIPSPFPILLNQTRFSAGLVVPISDIFLRALPALDIVRQMVDSQEQQARAAQINAAWQGREVYYGWLRATTARNVAQGSVDILEQTVQNIRVLVDAGVVPRIDLITVEASLEQARVGVSQADVGITMAENAIRILTGWDSVGAFEPGEDLLNTPLDPAPAPEDLVERALNQRPEVAVFAELLSISESSMEVQRRGGWPSLGFTANALYANPNPRYATGGSEFNGTWDVGVFLSWSPNSTLNARAEREQSAIEIEQVQDMLRAFELGLRNDASQAVAQWNSALATIRGARVQLDASEDELRSRNAALEGGIGTTTELLAAQGRMIAAWMDLINGTIELRRAMALADRVVGDGATAAVER